VSFVIAIDGPAASGKGTLAIRLGQALGLPVLDTGLLYRAVGSAVIAAGDSPDDGEAAGRAARALNFETLGAKDLRSAAAGEAASRVAVHATVREALLKFQRDFADREPGAILDGRDIGTVVAPGAPCKLFITATPEARARRRHAQLRARDETASYRAVLQDILRRDARDSGRDAAPLSRAADAVLLDTTDLDIDAAFDAALRIVEASRGGRDSS
jgi:cytidylate kinase